MVDQIDLDGESHQLQINSQIIGDKIEDLEPAYNRSIYQQINAFDSTDKAAFVVSLAQTTQFGMSSHFVVAHKNKHQLNLYDSMGGSDTNERKVYQNNLLRSLKAQYSGTKAQYPRTKIKELTITPAKTQESQNNAACGIHAGLKAGALNSGIKLPCRNFQEWEFIENSIRKALADVHTKRGAQQTAQACVEPLIKCMRDVFQSLGIKNRNSPSLLLFGNGSGHGKPRINKTTALLKHNSQSPVSANANVAEADLKQFIQDYQKHYDQSGCFCFFKRAKLDIEKLRGENRLNWEAILQHGAERNNKVWWGVSRTWEILEKMDYLDKEGLGKGKQASQAFKDAYDELAAKLKLKP